MEQIPKENMGKRAVSASLDHSGRHAKKLGDVNSMVAQPPRAEDMPAQAQDQIWGKVGGKEDLWLWRKRAKAPSPVRSLHAQGKSITTDLDEGTILDYTLTLQLQCSTRLRDSEAIKYYTHVLPTQSTMYKAMERTYQGYFYIVSQNKNHKLGPPMIHRGKTLLDHEVAGEVALKEKEGLKAMWPVVKEVVAEVASLDIVPVMQCTINPWRASFL